MSVCSCLSIHTFRMSGHELEDLFPTRGRLPSDAHRYGPYMLYRPVYSVLRVFTGFSEAARQLCHETAAIESNSTDAPASAKIHQSSEVL